MKSILNKFHLHRHHSRMEMPKPYNAEFSVAGNGSSKPSGRFVPPQPNNTGSSSQEMDNLNTTTVYYEESAGKCQNKSTSIQMSPRHLESRGTTTATQDNKHKGFTGWCNPNNTSTSPQEAYINRRNTNISSKKVTYIER